MAAPVKVTLAGQSTVTVEPAGVIAKPPAPGLLAV